VFSFFLNLFFHLSLCDSVLCGAQPKVSTRKTKKSEEEAEGNSALQAVDAVEAKEDYVYLSFWIPTDNVQLPTNLHFPLPTDGKHPEELLEGQRGTTGLIRPVTPEQVAKVQASSGLHNNEFDTSHPVITKHSIHPIGLGLG
jgi:hypothetical protein